MAAVGPHRGEGVVVQRGVDADLGDGCRALRGKGWSRSGDAEGVLDVEVAEQGLVRSGDGEAGVPDTGGRPLQLGRGDRVVDGVHLLSPDGSATTAPSAAAAGPAPETTKPSSSTCPRVPAQVDQIVSTLNSFAGQTFTEVQNAFCRLADETTGAEPARYTLTCGVEHTAQIMAKIQRAGSGWQMKAIGEPDTGRTFQDLLPSIAPHL